MPAEEKIMKSISLIKAKPHIPDLMSTIDWWIFWLILLITLLSVAWGHSRKNKNSSNIIDHLLMGRQLTLPLFVATLVATWYGGIFGVTRIAFEKGIYNFITQGVFWYITYLIFAIFLIDKIKKSDAVTLPDLIGKNFGPRSEKISAIFNFFNVVPVVYTISIGLLLQSFLGGSLILMSSLGVLLVVTYSMFGGFRAIVYSDLIQFIVMCVSVALVLLFSYSTFGGISFLQKSLPPTYFSLTGTESLFTTFVWGFIALSTLVDPNFYQRCFAAKDKKTAQRGIYISTIIWILFDICTTAGAMYAASTIPSANPETAYLVYAMQILPSGIRGVLLAGLFATILSTIDSYIFTAGTTLIYDLAPKKFKNSIRVHDVSLVFVGALSVVMAYYFDGNIKAIWKTLGSYSAACILFPVIVGFIFPGRISDKVFLQSTLLGVFGTTYWRWAEHSGVWLQIDDLYAGMACTLIGLLPALWKPQAKLEKQ